MRIFDLKSFDPASGQIFQLTYRDQHSTFIRCDASRREKRDGVERFPQHLLVQKLFKNKLTGAELGSPASFRCLVGGGRISPPPSNFRTNRRSEKREAAIESSQRGDSNAIFKLPLQGQMLGQGQVKDQSGLFSPYRLPRPD